MSQEQKHRYALSAQHRLADTLKKRNPGMNKFDINVLSNALVLKMLLSTSLLESSPDLILDWISNLYGRNSVEDVSKAYKAAATELRQHDVAYPWSSYDSRSFKRNGDILLSVRALFGPFMDRLESYLRGDSNPFSLEILLTVCEFESRIPIGSDNLAREAKRKYITFDHDMRYCVKQKTISDLRDIIVPLVNSYPWHFAEGRHGPGAVSELRSDSSYGSKENVIQNTNRSLRFGRLYGQMTVGYPVGSLIRSRWVSVPKNVLTRRSIAAEPAINQYHQQSVFSEFLPFLKQLGINLEDQTKNQNYAQEGSIKRNFATIDLSSASDSIHRQLVFDLFKGTKLFFPLFYSRTSEVDVDGTIVKLNKFCSMGSACCFPLQCLIFYAIVQLAYRNVGCKQSRWAVYGDDILVVEEAYFETLKLLQECGFQVNQVKTFPPWHSYKESCGGEYLLGFPVNPFRLPRNFEGVIGSSPRVDQLVDLCNESFIRGFFPLRKFIIQELMQHHPNRLYFSFCKDAGPGCLWTNRDPLDNDVIGLVDWQQDVIPVVVTKPRFSDEDRLCDLQAWLKIAMFSNRKYGVQLPIDKIENPRPIVTWVTTLTYVSV